MVALEASKTSDKLMVDFGIDLDDIALYAEKTALTEKKQIAGLIKMLEMQKATEEKKREIANRIPEELEKKIYDEAKAYGEAGKKSDGTLTWDTFLFI